MKKPEGKEVIQNEDVLKKVLLTRSRFTIPCRDKKDAHSKRVSLQTAKKRYFSEEVQAFIKLKVKEILGEFCVEVWFEEERKAFEVKEEEKSMLGKLDLEEF